jgi:hypothetical protein
MELGHLLNRSSLTYPEVSSKVCHDSFCQSGSSVSLPWVIYYQAHYLHVVSSFSWLLIKYHGKTDGHALHSRRYLFFRKEHQCILDCITYRLTTSEYCAQLRNGLTAAETLC